VDPKNKKVGEGKEGQRLSKQSAPWGQCEVANFVVANCHASWHAIISAP
jgi:hypothetical protein